ncbi:unnamed protein product [Danaus chrysippus]|uniref:(African queen) hypothetical protein n=1 Tax=Danaus chrysippus TaxID=151541 RepID=A0A8J2QKY1_9NEOP|nr:unnamed protein product [Danaus chrysippus]
MVPFPQLRETDEQLSRSGRLMNIMVTRALQQRAVLAAVLLVLALLAALGAYRADVKSERLVHSLVYWLYITCSKILPSGLRVWFVLRCVWAFLYYKYENLCC